MTDQNHTREYRHIDTLRNWDKNPRSISENDFKRLISQIKKLGQYKPLIITQDGLVLGGNMRLRAYRELGITEVWVSVVDAPTQKEMLEYALSDNDRAGQYDEELLAELIMDTKGFDQELYRVDLGKLSTIKELLSKFAPDADEDDAPAVEDGEPISKYGEVYHLGQHRLMCGDATNTSDIKTLMDGKQADLIFTDPPYNVNYKGTAKGRRDGILNDSMSPEQFYKFLNDSISNMIKVAQPHAPFYICMSQKELGSLKQAFEAAGGHWQSYIIWVKNNFTLGGSDFQHQYEPILYGWIEGMKHFWNGDRNHSDIWEDLDTISPKFNGTHTLIELPGYTLMLEGNITGQILKGKRQSNIWRYDKPAKSDEHPTMKPIKLITNALRMSSQIGNIVLDTFGGSGSTLIACQKTDRVCYTMELDPKYCDVIRKRYAQALGEENWQEATPCLKDSTTNTSNSSNSDSKTENSMSNTLPSQINTTAKKEDTQSEA